MNLPTEKAFWDFLWHMSFVFMTGAALAAPFWLTIGYMLGKRAGMKQAGTVQKPGPVYGHSDQEEAAIESMRRSGNMSGPFVMREDEE
jgi:hypothetical protein